MTDILCLPDALKPLAGRIIDADSHEMAPIQSWLSMYGPSIQPVVDLFLSYPTAQDRIDKNSANWPEYPGDVAPIDETIGAAKGCLAPAAQDISRRPAVMDAMGVSRQLMFSSHFGGYALILRDNADDPNFMAAITGDRVGFASDMVEIYNDWTVRTAAISDRVRPVPKLVGSSVEEVLSRAKALLDGGIRAIEFPSGDLIGGVSPLHPDLDPLWGMLVEAKCPAILHIGHDGKLLRTREWGNTPLFAGARPSGEFKLDPWSLATMHMAYQNFMSTMIVGGVFERHPDLILGIIEVGSSWVGPAMELLDFWYDQAQRLSKNDKLYRTPHPPSFYVKRNIRVTPFIFDDVASIIEKYGFEDVLCYSSDYPHVEGGKNAAAIFYDQIARFGPDVVEKFFVKNGEALLPA